MTFTGHLGLNTNKLTRCFDQDLHTTSGGTPSWYNSWLSSNTKTLVSLSKVRAGKVNWYSGRKRTDHQTSVGLWECLIVISRWGPVGREWGHRGQRRTRMRRLFQQQQASSMHRNFIRNTFPLPRPQQIVCTQAQLIDYLRRCQRCQSLSNPRVCGRLELDQKQLGEVRQFKTAKRPCMWDRLITIWFQIMW